MANHTFDKTNDVAASGNFSVRVKPQWIDIDPVDFSNVGAFLTTVVVKLGGAATETAYAFGEKAFSIAATAEGGDSGSTQSLSLHCQKTLP